MKEIKLTCKNNIVNRFRRGRRYKLVSNHPNVVAIVDDLGYKAYFRKNGKYGEDDNAFVGQGFPVEFSLIDYFEFNQRVIDEADKRML